MTELSDRHLAKLLRAATDALPELTNFIRDFLGVVREPFLSVSGLAPVVRTLEAFQTLVGVANASSPPARPSLVLASLSLSLSQVDALPSASAINLPMQHGALGKNLRQVCGMVVAQNAQDVVARGKLDSAARVMQLAATGGASAREARHALADVTSVVGKMTASLMMEGSAGDFEMLCQNISDTGIVLKIEAFKVFTPDILQLATTAIAARASCGHGRPPPPPH